MKSILLGVGPTNISNEAISVFDHSLYGCEHSLTKEKVINLENHINDLIGEQRCSFVIPGTGSTGMEACIVNILRENDKVLVCNGGVFASRLTTMCKRFKVDVTEIKANLGKGIDCAQLENLMKKDRYKLVCVIHVETSTGVMENIFEISRIVHNYGAIFLVDAVASFGGVALDTIKNDIDIFYSASQKCLSAPVGLSIISCSRKMMNFLSEQKSVRSWCWDYVNIYEHVKRGVYPFTTPISLIETLDKSLITIKKFGVEKYYRQQFVCSELVKKTLLQYNFKVFAKKEYEAPMVKTYIVPNGVDIIHMRKWLAKNYNIFVAGGLGDLKESTIRLGTMGNSANNDDIECFVSAIRRYMEYTKSKNLQYIC